MKLRILLTSALAFGFLLTPAVARAQDYAVDLSFNPSFSGRTHSVYDVTSALALQPDQKVLVGGDFTVVNGDASPLIVRLNPNGSRDTTFSSPLGFQPNDEVDTIKLQPDGKILVSGSFRLGGAPAGLVRLNSDGSIDSSFTPQLAGLAKSIKLYPDGRLLVCGGFSFNGMQPKLVRLFADGSVDGSFSVDLGGNYCSDVELSPDGSIFAAGEITSANGAGIPGLVKLTAAGAVDPSFVLPSANYPVISIEHFHIALQPDGKLLAAKKVLFWNAQQELSTFPSVVRYGTSGAAQPFSGCGNAEDYTVLFLQDNGKIITNGCSGGSPPYSYTFARLLPEGVVDTSLNQISFNNTIRSVVRQSDGNYVAIGFFNSVDGLARHRIVRLSAFVPSSRHRFDFDGDGKDDLGVFRPGDRYWYLNESSGGFVYAQWGLSTDKLVAADHDNDGKTDIAVFRDGIWYILQSSTNTLAVRNFGQAGDKPMLGDMNGDGRVDLVVRHTNPNTTIEWRVQYFGATGTSATQTLFNESGSYPGLIADLSGDNIDEMIFFNNGDWYSRQLGASSPLRQYHFGSPGDIPAAGDYDHDGQVDYAVFRPSTGDWYFNLTTSGFRSLHFGLNGDLPVPADYDGDGKTDVAVFRNGAWYQIRSSDGTFRGEMWGLTGDLPIPAQ